MSNGDVRHIRPTPGGSYISIEERIKRRELISLAISLRNERVSWGHIAIMMRVIHDYDYTPGTWRYWCRTDPRLKYRRPGNRTPEQLANLALGNGRRERTAA